jgi:hypothetical protein
VEEKHIGREAMKRGIYFIAEGATEVQFIESGLRYYFASKGIGDIRAFDMGGSNSYQRYQLDVSTFLKRESDIIVTSMIDFFRLPNDFPGFAEASQLQNRINRIELLERKIAESINHPRFVPYIQLHEFEGLLFSDIRGFDSLPGVGSSEKAELTAIIQSYPNPEMINDGPETAPSKRLLRIIHGYEKPLYGAYIALENGLESIISKCPRFASWLSKLEVEVMR